MTRAIRFARTGGPEVLTLEEVSLPEPKPGEVLVRHRAIGVNFLDLYHRNGLYPVPLPSGLGSEAAGVVEKIGDGVSEVRVGQRVGYAGGPPGAYSEARVYAANRLIPLPDDITDEVAAASLLKGMTAEFLIHRTYAVERGQTVLWHAAAGGVGLIACQWLAAIGARVIGTVGSDEKAELARRHGCHETIVYTRENFVKRVRELTADRGVAVVYDSVGKTTFLDSLSCLEPRGMMVSFGNASGKPEPLDILQLSQKGSLFLTRPTLVAYTASREELLASSSALFGAIESGVKIEIGQRFPLANAGEAQRALENRGTIGSTLLSL
ncbi:MAG TPA: quinone oxidoreductase [Polyangiaceae bacterium]|jgi:NADPH2:quinone reductase|nr:quinone oxidoreductase [Polyangiaceae bacterium]